MIKDISLDISVLVEDAAWQQKLPRLQKKIVAAVETALLAQHKLRLKHDSYELSVMLTHDKKIKALNKQHRGKDYATNVLSFPQDGVPMAPGMPAMIGDIVLTHGVIEAEAKAEGKPFNNHFLHLVVHGVLHLCSYDHITPSQARTMEGLEKTILTDLNIPDPYL